MWRHLISLLIMLPTLNTAASDLMRERRIANQITDAILEGEALWLEADGIRFLSIHTPASSSQTLGGVILLHGMGANPDWADVIHPLRVALPEQGWETLSIQMPLAANDTNAKDYWTLIPEAAPRIEAAIAHLRTRQITNLALVGHSLGARMGLAFLARNKPREIRAFVAIGLPTPAVTQENPVLTALAQLDIPMLDLYGSRDLTSVIQGAKLRQAAASGSGRGLYRQDRVEGADHFFNGLNGALEKHVGSWLRRYAQDKAASA